MLLVHVWICFALFARSRRGLVSDPSLRQGTEQSGPTATQPGEAIQTPECDIDGFKLQQKDIPQGPTHAMAIVRLESQGEKPAYVKLDTMPLFHVTELTFDQLNTEIGNSFLMLHLDENGKFESAASHKGPLAFDSGVSCQMTFDKMLQSLQYKIKKTPTLLSRLWGVVTCQNVNVQRWDPICYNCQDFIVDVVSTLFAEDDEDIIAGIAPCIKQDFNCLETSPAAFIAAPVVPCVSRAVTRPVRTVKHKMQYGDNTARVAQGNALALGDYTVTDVYVFWQETGSLGNVVSEEDQQFAYKNHGQASAAGK